MPVSYELVYTTQAKKDAKKLKGSPLAQKARELLEVIREIHSRIHHHSRRWLVISRESIHGV